MMNVQPFEQPEEREQQKGSLSVPVTHTLVPQASALRALEDVRLGKIYPPPPDFFKTLPERPEPHYLPGAPIAPASVRNQLPPAVPMGRYTPGSPPVPAQSRAPQKMPRWLRIFVWVTSVIILFGLGACGWLSFQVFGIAYQQVTGSVNVANSYYGAIEAKNYSAAYADLNPQGSIRGLTQAQFIQHAQQIDSQDGPITDYTPGVPNYNYSATSLPDLSSFTLPITVSRTHTAYTVTLTLQKVRGQWKIIDFTKI